MKKSNVSVVYKENDLYPARTSKQKKNDTILIVVIHAILFFTLVAIDFWIKMQ